MRGRTQTAEAERHNTRHGAIDCWRNPEYLRVCPECDGEGVCWRCDDTGTLPLSRWQVEEATIPIIIVHNE